MKKPRKPWRLLGFCDRHLFRSYQKQLLCIPLWGRRGGCHEVTGGVGGWWGWDWHGKCVRTYPCCRFRIAPRSPARLRSATAATRAVALHLPPAARKRTPPTSYARRIAIADCEFKSLPRLAAGKQKTRGHRTVSSCFLADNPCSYTMHHF